MRPTESGRRRRSTSDIVQQPWTPLSNNLPPRELISKDEVSTLHEAALTILEEIGILCPVIEVQDLLKKAGASVGENGTSRPAVTLWRKR